MKKETIIPWTIFRLLTILLLFGHRCDAQTINKDSSGLDSSEVLNKYEIALLDSIFSDPLFEKSKHEFKDKKIAFFSATEYLPKDEFFKIAKSYRGPKGFDVLDENQQRETGYDIIILINVKAYQKDYYTNKLKNLVRHGNK